MELLHEWIGPTIEHELGKVLEWRGKSEASRSQVVGTVGDLTFDDDGSNLRIRSAKKQVVQIIKSYPDQEPLQACLSDSVGRVEATIAKDAVQTYRRKTGKRLTDGTVGGIIQLLDFEIVATHIGGRQKRITLFVTDFKNLGANGAGSYGFPQAIQDRDKVKELLQTLIEFRARESAEKQASSWQEHSSRHPTPQPYNIASQEHSPRDTQTVFATQAPLPILPAIRSPETRASESHNGRSALHLRNQLPHKPQVQDDQAQDKANRHITENEQLLDLLRSRKQLQNTKAAPLESTRMHLANAATVSSDTATISGQHSMRPRSQSHEIGDVSKHHSLSPSISKSEDTPQDAQATLKMHETAANIRTRISSKEVKILKDQEKLLNDVDSWLPAEPGRRGPVANVPISILQDFNRKADLQARIFAKSLQEHGRRNGLEQSKTPNSNAPIEVELSSRPGSELDDDDAPISTSEWPPSPARNQLPPDSSMESSDALSKSSIHTRKSSSASMSSRVTQSRRMSPPSVMRSLRNSMEVSSDIPSPSLVACTNRQDIEQRAQSSTPNSSAACTLTPVSIGAVSAKLRHLKQSNSNGYHEHVVQDDSQGEARDIMENTASITISSREPRISEILNSLQPLHDGRLPHSPEATMPSHLPNHVSSQERSLGSPRASSPHDLLPWQSLEAQPTTEKYIGTTNRCDTSASFSIPPSPESDLEMAIPYSLKDKVADTGGLTSQAIPSTAFQPIEPFTQVKRTPYVNGQSSKYSPPRDERQSSFPKLISSRSVANGIRPEDVDHVSQSTASVVEVSSSDAFTDNMKQVLHIEDTNDPLAITRMIGKRQGHEIQTTANDDIHKTDNLNREQTIMNESHAIDQPPAEAHSKERSASTVIVQNDYETLNGSETKRKASDVDFLPATVSKRRKKFKLPRTFPVTETIEDRPDPANLARLYRQEFITSHGSSETNRPEHNAATPMVIFEVGTTESEDSRAYPEAQVVVPETSSGIDRQASLDYTAPTSRPRGDKAMGIDVILSKQSTEVDSDQDAEMKEAHSALNKNDSLTGNVRKSIDLVNDSHKQHQPRGAGAQLIPNGVSPHILDGDGAPEDENAEKSLDVGAEAAEPKFKYDHPTLFEGSSANSRAQAVKAAVSGVKVPRQSVSPDKDIALEADDAGLSLNADGRVNLGASQNPEDTEYMDLDSGTAPPNQYSGQSADNNANDVAPSAQNDGSLDRSTGRSKIETVTLGTANVLEYELCSHANGRYLDISRSPKNLDHLTARETIGVRADPLSDHGEIIPDPPILPNLHASESVQGRSKPGARALSPIRVVSKPPQPGLHNIQEHEPSNATVSVRLDKDGSADRLLSPASVSAPVLKDYTKARIEASHPTKQSDLSEDFEPNENIKKPTLTVKAAAEPKTPSAPPNIFDLFKATYPAYSGDLRHFVAVSKKIKSLFDSNRILHQYLWDDFIIRHKIEYAQYLRQCAEDAEDALPYEDFYNMEIEGPLFCNRLITNQNIADALSLMDVKSSVPGKKMVVETEVHDKHTSDASGVNVKRLMASNDTSPSVQKLSKKRETIDLTLDDQDDDAIEAFDKTSIISPMSGVRKMRRSLPWKGADADRETTRSQRLERSSSGLGEAEARSRVLTEPVGILATSGRDVSRKSDAIKVHQSIREAWGVGPHDVLEPRYYDKISPRHLQLMNDIARMVDLEQARRLLYDKIHSRTGLDPSASRAMTVADLEGILDALMIKTVRQIDPSASKRSIHGPPDTPRMQASERVRDDDERPGQWWKDENTPFKSFVRAYTSIRPGNGNSYAMKGPSKSPAGSSRMKREHTRKGNNKRPKSIDPMSWEL